jgi:uncharacterized protein DUF4157
VTAKWRTQSHNRQVRDSQQTHQPDSHADGPSGRSVERKGDSTTNVGDRVREPRHRLPIGPSSDSHEQAADGLAAQLLRMPARNAPAHNAGLTSQSDAPSSVRDVLATSGHPISSQARSLFEPEVRLDLTSVRLHDDAHASASARSIDAVAYSLGRDIVVDADQFVPNTLGGLWVLAHELAHVAQGQSAQASQTVRRYGTPIPTVASPSVTTMRQFIDLVKRVEAANPGRSAIQIAQLLMRSKYHSQGFDWLLPSTAGAPGVTPGPGVTAADVVTLSGEFTVTLPQGGQSDPSHIVTAITAAAETQAPGAGGAGGVSGRLVSTPPAGLTQLDIASWAGDPGSAAAEWGWAHPHPTGGTTKQNYMDEFSPESDMIGDIDGVVMTSRSAATGFVFDPTTPLSSNLERFYYPTNPREGKNRRFHSFCAILGFALEPDGVTLTTTANTAIDNRIKAFADWFGANDPNLLAWVQINSPPSVSSLGGPGSFGSAPIYNPIWSEWTSRGSDWRWFAAKFRDFVQRNLSAEGP